MRSTSISLLLLLAAAACGDDAGRDYQGYVEGEFVLVGPPESGWITSVDVKRGDKVKEGDLLFTLESTREEALRNAAAARLVETQSRLDNLLKGKRIEEIDVIDQQIQEAEANLRFATAEFERQESLSRTNAGARRNLEQARSAQASAAARVRELKGQREVATLPARPDEVDAARAMVKAAEASLAEAEWRLAQRRIAARVEGSVEDTMRRTGEFVPAGAPVVSLLPPQNIIVRFFVPETAVSQLRLGQAVTIACDGCPQDARGEVSFIASDAEFTPPVIYSVENREKLVFLIEAKSNGLSALRPGLPVDVRVVP
jgi:HlyD family secretion protein